MIDDESPSCNYQSNQNKNNSTFSLQKKLHYLDCFYSMDFIQKRKSSLLFLTKAAVLESFPPEKNAFLWIKL